MHEVGVWEDVRGKKECDYFSAREKLSGLKISITCARESAKKARRKADYESRLPWPRRTAHCPRGSQNSEEGADSVSHSLAAITRRATDSARVEATARLCRAHNAQFAIRETRKALRARRLPVRDLLAQIFFNSLLAALA